MKKTVSLTTLALVLSAGSALAADLPSRKAEPMLPPPPPPMWTGFYAGLNAGYGFGVNSGASVTNGSGTYLPAAPAWNPARTYTAATNGVGFATSGNAVLDQNGFIGGGQVGYNFQFMDRYVVGFEADIQGTTISGGGNTQGVGTDALRSMTLAAPIAPAGHFGYSAGSTAVNAGIDWLGTVRGRLGYLVTPRLLVYGTGGLTYGDVYATTTTEATRSLYNLGGAFQGDQPFYGTGSQSSTRVGWNAGGGFEWMLSPNWSAKVEGIYYDLGSMNVSTGAVAGANALIMRLAGGVPAAATAGNADVRFNGIIARAGLNYHFNMGSSSTAFDPVLASGLPSLKGPGEAATVAGWNGFYAGLNADYGFGGSNAVDNTSAVFDQFYPNYFAQPGWPQFLQGTYGGIARANRGAITLDQNGFAGGGQVGYNYQWSQSVVAGLEADMQGASIRGGGNYSGAGQDRYSMGSTMLMNHGTRNTVAGANIQAGLDWFGTVRGRLGFLATPTMLLYGTAGLTYGGAWAKGDYTSMSSMSGPMIWSGNNSNPVSVSQMGIGSGSTSNVLVGWNAGGGVEWMFMQNWSAKAEAFYYDLGALNLTSATVAPASGVAAQMGRNVPDAQIIFQNTRVNYNGVIARVGVNYHFNWGSAPVVASY